MKAEAEARAQAEVKAKADKLAAEAKARAEAEDKARALAAAKAQAEEKARLVAEAKLAAEAKANADKLAAEAKAKAEAEAKARVVAEAKAKAEDKARKLAEAKADAEEKARLAAEAKAEAEAQAKADARARADKLAAEAKARADKQAADSKAKADAEALARAEAKAKADENARLIAEKAKADKLAAEAAVRAKTDKATADAAATAKAKQRLGGIIVKRIDFADYSDHSEVIIDVSGLVKYALLPTKRQRTVLRLEQTNLPKDLEQTLDASDYNGPVQAVSSYADPDVPGATRVVIDLAADLEPELRRTGTGFVISYDRAAFAAATQKPSQRVGSVPPPRVASYTPGGPAPSTRVAQVGGRRTQGPRKKVDLDFKDADIHNVLRIMSTVVGVDIVVPDDVKATVTVRMTDVYWYDALDVILKSKGLEWTQRGRLVRVLTQAQADAERKQAEEEAQKRRVEEPVRPEIFTLNYARASELIENIEDLRSARGRIAVDDRTNSIIVTDVAATRDAIRDLLSYLDTQTPQVLIEARVVEARSTFAREIGVQWGYGFSASPAGGNGTGLVFPSTIATTGANGGGDTRGVSADPEFAVNLPAGISPGEGGGVGLTLGSVGGNFNINLRLTALEDMGTVRIVSAPKILTLDNQRATISQGVSIPIQVIGPQGAQTQFVPADLQLEVVPHVTRADCSVVMDILVRKNEADFNNRGARGDPSILRKEAHTNLIVRDGDTAVIGGIYTRQTGHAVRTVPWFGKLPIIGFFFRNERRSDDRTEVLIFITPRITNRAFLQCVDERGPARRKVR